MEVREIMKKEEVKIPILLAFRHWSKLPANANMRMDGAAAQAFYDDLYSTRSSLLGFEADGNKAQIIRGWLLNANLINH
jgi:hypothetical protein